jgi:hypothetical protein
MDKERQTIDGLVQQLRPHGRRKHSWLRWSCVPPDSGGVQPRLPHGTFARSNRSTLSCDTVLLLQA